MSRFITDHHLTPEIAQVFDFADAPAAYRNQQAPRTFGKTVIEIGSSRPRPAAAQRGHGACLAGEVRHRSPDLARQGELP